MRPTNLSALLAAALSFLSISLPSATADQDSSINVALKASFQPAPYLVELLETAALENSSCYFPLLDRIADGTFAHLHSDQELYTKFLDVLQQDGHLGEQGSLSSFKLALSLHAAAPRIEAHYQYYKSAVEPSMMAAQDAACPVWVHLDGQQYCSPELERAQQPVDNDNLEAELPFDHTLSSADSSLLSTIYADITHPLFGQFHQIVSATAKDGKSAYRVRYRPNTQDSSQPLYVSGYGVELVLKRTDYIVIDDRDAAHQPGSTDEASSATAVAEIKPLTSAEVSKLGLNAASYIMASDDPMITLLEVSANFPKYASTIASHNASSALVIEHKQNRDKLLPAGYNVIWMNGLQVQNREVDAYSLIDVLRKERQLIKRLKDIGLSSTEAIDLLSHEVLALSQTDDQPQRYDWRSPADSREIIIWLNNIEKDTRYARWPTSLNMLLQRTYPGQLPQVRRDIHNVIVPIDFHNVRHLDLIVNTLQTLVKRSFPLQLGLVPIGTDEPSRQAAKLSYHILDTYGLGRLLTFYQNIVTSKKGVSAVATVFESLTGALTAKEGTSPLSYNQVQQDEELRETLKNADAYASRLALNNKNPPVLVNGVAIPRTETWFETLSQRIYMDHRALQVAVYEGNIAEGTWIPDFFLQRAATRRNSLVVPENKKEVRVVNVAEITTKHASSYNTLPRIPGENSALLSSCAHLLLALDLDSPHGRDLLAEALAFHEKRPEVEVLLLHSQRPGEPLSALPIELYHNVRDGSRDLPRAQLKVLVNEKGDDVPPTSQDQEKAMDYWLSHEDLIRAIGLTPGDNAISLNGRVVGPLVDAFTGEDFESLLDYEISERIAPVTTAITALSLEDKFSHPLDVAKVTSIVASSLISDIPEGIYEAAPLIRLDKFKQWKNESTMIHLPSDTEPSIQIVAAIDPASETAQNWLPILKTLADLDGVDVKLFLNPREQLSELPVKRFYRNVIAPSPTFSANGSLAAPQAVFSTIPPDVLFNLGMVVPPAWLVSPEESIYDLDNIKLSSVPAGQNVDALYELEHILIEGHSRDITKGTPPRGAQLLLGTEQNPHFTDTIIMANVGYFQFKANPGHWQLTLKPGRSSRIFDIDSVGSRGYAPQPGDEGNQVTLMSFQGVTLFPRLSRKAGMEDEDVLEVGSLADTAASYLKKGQSLLSSIGLGKKTASGSVQADINIFSVASGHLYERMLNIMMLSVVKHTSHSVKFWFIEQFLSPSFKRSLPYLAEHYGFQFEMVTYKWPHWLRGQKEKQREIWGYKILFLDVLFPLDLEKVIFVDADQIVRTDMMELNKVDLHGAPYGFTPMCDSRTEMEGFRFWKQGYWANFLEGKPYHISALYVVDLKRFRELAAGDRLRGQYHALSADPNSLSNLDQDLPNHMQHNLPIHSLDQDWLWCETWCSDEALGTARTIDLCNNPMTKEPKLDRARRQVPEWTEYDNEIAEVLKGAMKDKGEVDLKAGSEKQNDELYGRRKEKVKDEL
ncbi:killer toxin resistant protein [Lithohypha guttulata]|uniref:Killer toxin resistant protein n=1 Tax=Lithohypha guttulata TaxID=1690604 RepID=A0AAN7YDH7_9EURO|nr:killer toxin resistant protein [Lithohypha guttulata]